MYGDLASIKAMGTAGMNEDMTLGKLRSVGSMPSKGGDRKTFLFGENGQAIFGNAIVDVAQIYIL